MRRHAESRAADVPTGDGAWLKNDENVIGKRMLHECKLPIALCFGNNIDAEPAVLSQRKAKNKKAVPL